MFKIDLGVPTVSTSLRDATLIRDALDLEINILTNKIKN